MVGYCCRKAQVTIEYTMVAICIVAALLAMQHYIKRAVQGRLHEAADSIGGQYDPRHISSTVTLTQQGTTKIDAAQEQQRSGDAEEGVVEGIRTKITTENERIERTGNEQLEKFPAKLFD